MIENLDITIELHMNNEIIYMWIIDDECFYTDVSLKNCDVGCEITYYSIKDIKRNMKLYKNYDLIKYLKNGASVEFEKDIIMSLKENLNDPKTKDCEIDYSINDKLLSVGYRTNDKYICKDYKNVSISNVKKILSWIKKDKLKIIELMIKWC